jgi:hypothetical protein
MTDVDARALAEKCCKNMPAVGDWSTRAKQDVAWEAKVAHVQAAIEEALAARPQVSEAALQDALDAGWKDGDDAFHDGDALVALKKLLATPPKPARDLPDEGRLGAIALTATREYQDEAILSIEGLGKAVAASIEAWRREELGQLAIAVVRDALDQAVDDVLTLLHNPKGEADD